MGEGFGGLGAHTTPLWHQTHGLGTRSYVPRRLSHSAARWCDVLRRGGPGAALLVSGLGATRALRPRPLALAPFNIAHPLQPSTGRSFIASAGEALHHLGELAPLGVAESVFPRPCEIVQSGIVLPLVHFEPAAMWARASRRLPTHTPHGRNSRVRRGGVQRSRG
jgi:hypothetical protein